MKFSAFVFFILLIISESLRAQNYFQQEVNYTIDVSLNDTKHELSASENIVYKNNSPAALNVLYFHLWPNAYKDQNTVLAKEILKSGDDRFLNAGPDDYGYIDSLNFSVDGKTVSWELLQDTIDICRIHLTAPLMPGSSINISTPFQVKIPSDAISRMGHNGQAYTISQWYPKPAVYDLNGWNYFPYLDQGEYYSEFGSFDVKITLPQNYVVGATGVLTDSTTEMNWLNLKAQETAMMTDFPTTMSFPVSSKELKTLHYRQDNIHDFAWFADKRWNVLKGEVELPLSKRKVTTWSFFTNAEAPMWRQAPEYISRAVKYYSAWVGEYPYDNVTAVDVTNAAGNGMEYPMVTAIGSYGDPFELEVTIVHEVGHNWFYGVLGSNERCHPWMDEGINNFYETRYVYTQYSGKPRQQMETTTKKDWTHGRNYLERINHREKQYLGYIESARSNSDVSQDACAQNLSNINYRNEVYYKSSISFDYLKTYLGDSTFDACMHEYFRSWKFKHPMPDDIKNVFENTSGQKLGWFFNDLIRTNKKLDYSFSSSQINNDKINLTLKNKGKINAPFSISAMRNDSILSTVQTEGFSKKKIIEMPFFPQSIYRIDAGMKMPELRRGNNTIRSTGILKRMSPLSLDFLTGPEKPDRTHIFYIPAIGFNKYNSVMAGIVLNNINRFEKKTEFAVMPLYATRTKDLAGGATLDFNFYPGNSVINKITWSEGLSHYAYGNDEYVDNNEEIFTRTMEFSKIDSRITFHFRPSDAQSNADENLILREIFINRDIPFGSIPFNLTNGNYSNDIKFNYNYLQLIYHREKPNPIDKSMQVLSFTMNKDFVKLTGEIRKLLTYGKAGKGFEVRLFGGWTSIKNVIQPGVDYRFSLDGTTGNRDYLFDNVFLGRSENTGFYSQQFVLSDGGFKVPTLFYRKADKWMGAINLSTTLPGILPFKIFFDAGAFNDYALSTTTENKFSFDYGLEIPVVKDILTVYVPFGYSADIKYLIDRENLHFGNLIRFELNFRKLCPLANIRNKYPN